MVHLIALADANGLPADANRDTLRAFAKTRGLGLRTDALRRGHQAPKG